MSTGSISIPKLGSLRLRVSIDAAARRDVGQAFLASRLIVFVVGVATAAIVPFGNREWGGLITKPFLHPFGSWPLGGLFDAIVSPFVRGDATVYSAIAYHGYRQPIETSFFPGFPFAVRFLGGFASPAAAVLVGSVLSLVAFGAALLLLHRLATLELGQHAARATILLVAFCPAAVFFSMPYTESLYLLLSVAAFYCARTERWPLAAALAAAAALTRNIGVMLIIPLALLYLQSHTRTPRLIADARSRLLAGFDRRLLWLLLIPIAPIAYSVYLQHTFGDWLSWVHSQALWGRQSAAPWTSVIDGLRVGWRVLLGHSNYDGGELVDLAFLGTGALLTVAALRRLPLAYGVYSIAIILPALMDPILGNHPEPLHGVPRYVLVAFPLFMALGSWAEDRGVTRWLVPISAVGLVGMTAVLAAWLPYY